MRPVTCAASRGARSLYYAEPRRDFRLLPRHHDRSASSGVAHDREGQDFDRCGEIAFPERRSPEILARAVVRVKPARSLADDESTQVVGWQDPYRVRNGR